MVVNLKQLYNITGESLDINYSLDNEKLSELRYTFASPVLVKGRICNRAGIVTLDYTSLFTLSAECDRCLGRFERQYEFDNEHILVRSLNSEADDDYIVTESDLLDLDELVISDILLSLPTKMLCKEDCKGLCPVCGTDLNKNVCNCYRYEG